jgi:hypothetical protein
MPVPNIAASDRPERLAAIFQPMAGAHPPLVVTEGACALLSYDVDDDYCVIVEFWNMREMRSACFSTGEHATHALHPRGLAVDGAFEIRDSTWRRAHEAANREQALGEHLGLTRMRHFAVATAGSLFECLAEKIDLITTLPNDAENSVALLRRVARQLGWKLPDD